MNGNLSQWIETADGSVFLMVLESFEKARTDRIELKRACRKHEAPLAARGDVWICNICGRYLLSKAGWVNHPKSHNPGSIQTISFASALPDNQQAEFTLPHCTKVCKSAGGLKRHLRIHSSHDTTPSPTIGNLHICSICRKACKTLAGLKSHLRAHWRETTDGVASFWQEDATKTYIYISKYRKKLGINWIVTMKQTKGERRKQSQPLSLQSWARGCKD